MKQFYRIKIVLFLFVVFYSCKEKEPEPDDNFYIPTPVAITLPNGWPAFTIPSNNQLTKEGIELGRRLFYDPLLSGNNKQSCSSCHNISYSFVDSTNRFSKGIDGTMGKRNSMPLFNLLWSTKFFWDGRAVSLEDQALKPITDVTEMHENWPNLLNELKNHPQYPALFKMAFMTDEITPELVGKAIAQFERTLISKGSKFDKNIFGLTASELRGKQIFETEAFKQIENPSLPPGGDCFHCHGSPGSVLFQSTTKQMSNNGIDLQPDSGYAIVTGLSTDIGKFKIPSLRNLKYTAPYMHDGRFNTLEEVIQHYNTGVKFSSPNLDPDIKKHNGKPLGLNAADIQDLVNFLNTLNDEEFIVNEAHSSPFK
ncbi:MAG TPA: cytochrome c peroxidase [Bacteroidia bacterium]|nr:cytochrome c peroxidase [Bacteroidia bacterium]